MPQLRAAEGGTAQFADHVEAPSYSRRTAGMLSRRRRGGVTQMATLSSRGNHGVRLYIRGRIRMNPLIEKPG